MFWDMTPCSPVSVNRRFGGTYRLHLQGRRNELSKKPTCKQKKQQLACRLLACWFLSELISSTLKRRYVSPKRRLTLNGLHGVISQKMILFITTAVKTSNPTLWTYFVFEISERNMTRRILTVKNIAFFVFAH
jgi:hypothetical protein